MNYEICGMKCIDKPVKFEFYKKTFSKNFNPDKYKVKAIYGENGAGKTAIILGVDLLKNLIANELYLTSETNQMYLDEVVNKSNSNLYIECEFFTQNNNYKRVYKYYIELKKRNELFYISKECLSRRKAIYDNNSYEVVYSTNEGELKQCEKKYYEKYRLGTLNTLSKQSFAIGIFDLFCDDNSIISDSITFISIIDLIKFAMSLKVFLDKEDMHAPYFINRRIAGAREIKQKEVFYKDILNLMDRAEMLWGSNKIIIERNEFKEYQNKVKRLEMYLKKFKRDLKTIDIETVERGDTIECRLKLNYGKYVIDREFESTGIKKLIRLFESFNAASDGQIVFIDEIDSNINDVYLGKLVEYFMYYGKGQLCFTLHNPSVMNVLRSNKKAIDFLATNNKVISWTTSGNASPEKAYKNGMIENLPFNIEASSFIGILGE